VKLLYKPFGLAIGALSGLLAGLAFKRLWRAAAREEDTPNATDRERGWPEVVLAGALQGAVFGGVKAVVDRAGATGFAHATGVWPGDEQTKKQKNRS